MENTNQPIVHLITDDEVKGKAKDLFEQIKKSSGEVPKWMRVMANCEDTLIGFFTLFQSVMDNAPADKNLKWKLAYLVSELNECKFCVGVAKMKLQEFGFGEEDFQAIEKTFDEKEKIAAQFARETTEAAYKINPETIKKMKENFTDEQIVEITAVIGLFNFVNRFNDALKILPDVK